MGSAVTEAAASAATAGATAAASAVTPAPETGRKVDAGRCALTERFPRAAGKTVTLTLTKPPTRPPRQ